MIDWTLMFAIIAILSVIISAVVYYFIKPVSKAFEFDNGTTQGWTVSPMTDDSGKQYFLPSTPPTSIFSVRHWERDQYPKQLGTDPDSDKNGCLLVAPSDTMQLSLNEPALDFPKTSKWHIDIVSPNLTNVFAGITSFEAHIADQLNQSSTPYIRATLLLRVMQNNTTVDIPEIGGSVKTPLQPKQWTDISSNFSVPVVAIIKNLVIRLEGDYMLVYEGWLSVDHVCAK